MYDCIVVGAGHAGVEAAYAAARLGANVALVSGNLDTIGKMSCNPAIGGVAKGQVVREIDALGGLMAEATDANGIHWRILGSSKGPAMWSPRAQADKHAYSTWMKHRIEQVPGILPVQGDCLGLIIDERTVSGIMLKDGREVRAPRVVLTTGTFLQGLMHQGSSKTQGGRMGDGPGLGISESLKQLGLTLGRMKTGTPARVHMHSIDFSHCTPQPGDPSPKPFCFDGPPPIHGNAIECWRCDTTAKAHEVITANLDKAPMYNGQIDSVGPRYCPSIEDKVVRFSQRDSHQLVLEPEGIHSQEVYINGLSTSLPIDIQQQMMAHIPALAKAHVMRYGYAVEYDMVMPHQLDHTLKVRDCRGLYLAGQVNGTSGYEEAAAQGLVAGTNAILSIDGSKSLISERSESYIGVMIDDLVNSNLDEPYRLFTSRAEHRLSLRADNADRRLVPRAAHCGLVDTAQLNAVRAKDTAIKAAIKRVGDQGARQVAGSAMTLGATMKAHPWMAELDLDIAEGAWIELRYAHYLDRHKDRIERMARMGEAPIPADLDFTTVPAMSTEGRNRLNAGKPRTLAEARRIPGMTPGDIEGLWAWLQSRQGTS